MMMCGVVCMQYQANSCVFHADQAAVRCSMWCRSEGRGIQKAPNAHDENGEPYHNALKEFFMLTGLAVKLNMEAMLDSVSVCECVWVGGFKMLFMCDWSSMHEPFVGGNRQLATIVGKSAEGKRAFP